ncbi:SGNH/GDSL hydrolase family protein [Lacihabitans lacunae]|uniref:SGNH/GDSL hydrolase family protein n=1 Tax=Lacihabitans lacunae TaxID=1028214 RepID=A0ABV7YTH6_9BACT
MKKLSLLSVVLFFLFSFTEPSKKWVAIGDSITYLNDHLDQTENRVTKGYLTQVKEKLPQVEFVNKGYNGWTVIKIADNIEKLGIEKADIYSVFLGTNDWWGGNALGTFEDYKNSTGTKTVFGAYRQIMDKIKSLNPDAKVVLLTPMKRMDFVYLSNFKNKAYGSYKEKNNQSLEQFSDAVVQIGRYENVEVVDLFHHKKLDYRYLVKFNYSFDKESGKYLKLKYPHNKNLTFDPEKDKYPYPVDAVDMTFDGLHPSDGGNKVIAKELVKKFKLWL